MHTNNHKGFIGATFLIVLALLILQLGFEVNILGWLHSPQVVGVFVYLKKFIILLWNTLIETPVMWFWETVITGFVWKYIVIVWGFLTQWVDSKS